MTNEEIIEKYGGTFGIFGIGPDLKIHDGSDGRIYLRGIDFDEDDEDYPSFEEVIQIADICINRWIEFRASMLILIKERKNED